MLVQVKLEMRGSTMQVGNQLEFHCIHCKTPVYFSVLESETFHSCISCSHCNKQYSFDDNTILRHLQLFEKLCLQIHESKEILGNTHVAVSVGSQEVKIPYKILLSRLNSVIELKIEGQIIQIKFRIEPVQVLEEKIAGKH